MTTQLFWPEIARLGEELIAGGHRDRLRPAAAAELAADVLHVRRDRLGADDQPRAMSVQRSPSLGSVSTSCSRRISPDAGARERLADILRVRRRERGTRARASLARTPGSPVRASRHADLC